MKIDIDPKLLYQLKILVDKIREENKYCTSEMGYKSIFTVEQAYDIALKIIQNNTLDEIHNEIIEMNRLFKEFRNDQKKYTESLNYKSFKPEPESSPF